MNRAEVNECISANLWSEGFGRGFGYAYYLNGECLRHNGGKELRRLARQDDKVSIRVHSKRYWLDTVDFIIEPNSYVVRRHKEYKARFKRARDSNRSKVYAWANYLSRGCQLTPKQINGLVSDIYNTYGYSGHEPNVIVTYAKKAFSTYFGSKHEIRLAAGWGQEERTVLHEVAHALIATMGLNKTVASHGKEFVGLFMELCEIWLNTTDRELANARKEGLNLGTEHRIKYD